MLEKVEIIHCWEQRKELLRLHFVALRMTIVWRSGLEQGQYQTCQYAKTPKSHIQYTNKRPANTLIPQPAKKPIPISFATLCTLRETQMFGTSYCHFLHTRRPCPCMPWTGNEYPTVWQTQLPQNGRAILYTRVHVRPVPGVTTRTCGHASRGRLINLCTVASQRGATRFLYIDVVIYI